LIYCFCNWEESYRFSISRYERRVVVRWVWNIPCKWWAFKFEVCQKSCRSSSLRNVSWLNFVANFVPTPNPRTTFLLSYLKFENDNSPGISRTRRTTALLSCFKLESKIKIYFFSYDICATWIFYRLKRVVVLRVWGMSAG
jgi:hypothetical protein